MSRHLFALLLFTCLPCQLSHGKAAELDDLYLDEVHTTGDNPKFALFLTGDGGWAALDKGVSARLASRGIAVAGFNCRDYFWKARQPDQAARDVARVMRYYLKAWNKTHVILIGYSFGADVMPFIVNRLPQDLRAHIDSVILLGLGSHALFEVHIADWVPGLESGGRPIEPELPGLTSLPVLCIYGEGEHDTLCPKLPGEHTVRERIGSGHHFGRDYDFLGDRILAFESRTELRPLVPAH